MKTKPFNQFNGLLALALWLCASSSAFGTTFPTGLAEQYEDLLPQEAFMPQIYFGKEAPVELANGQLVHPSAVPKVLLPDRDFGVTLRPAEVQNNSPVEAQMADPCSIDNQLVSGCQ